MPTFMQRPVKLSDHVVESILEKIVTEMIARDLDIKPEEVTPEFIHKWREEKLYPVANVDLTTLYGGYNGVGRRIITGSQIRSDREVAEAFLSRFPADKEGEA